MHEEWTPNKLGEITTWKSGGTPPKFKPEFWNGNIPWISAKSLKGRYVSDSDTKITKEGLEKGSKIANKGSILFLVRGSGLFNDIPVAMASCDVAYNQDVKCVNPKIQNLSSDFLLYWFKGKKHIFTNLLESTSIGAGKFDLARLLDLEILLPHLSEQTAIASILSALDDKIELNLQMNKTLEAMAMALYKHWFVDFGPFQKGEFVDSELGRIPEGWEVKCLKDMIILNPRLNLPRGTSASFVEMKALPIDVMSVSNVACKSFSGGTKFQNEDTLFARITPCLENGKTAYVDFLNDVEVGFGSTEFLVMRAQENVSRYWVYALSRDSNFRKFAISTMVGTSGRQRVQNEPFLLYKVAKAPARVSADFTSIVGPWFSQIRNNTIENQTLTSLRDTLLPKLITGEIRVKEAEQILADAL